jgi:hypothetical protein
MSKLLSPILLLVVLLVACNEEPIETSKNTVQFSILPKNISNGRQLEEIPKSVILSIENQAGEIIFENEQYSLTKINETYLIDPILLEVEDYNLTKFLVLNDDDEVIYATPLAGSNFASFVDSPLPINFPIVADNETDVKVEVIYTDSIDPEDLGYASISFNIVPTTDILYSVFGYDDISSSYTFLSGDLTVSGDQDSLFTVGYGDSVNVIKLRKDYDSLSFDFSALGFISTTAKISTDNLGQYRTVPLEIILQSEQNLWAYFPFNGDSKEVTGSSLQGNIQGSVLTQDRNGIENSAYSFNGINDNIKYGDNFDLGSTDFTISVWTKVDDFKGLVPNTSTRGAYAVNKGLTKYGNPSRAGYGIIALSENNENRFGFSIGGNDQTFHAKGSNDFKTNQWYHVVGVRKGNLISLYVNGIKITETSVPDPLNTNTNIPFSVGTNDKLGNDAAGTTYFEGSVDEIKIYDVALSQEEILNLFNQ